MPPTQPRRRQQSARIKLAQVFLQDIPVVVAAQCPAADLVALDSKRNPKSCRLKADFEAPSTRAEPNCCRPFPRAQTVEFQAESILPSSTQTPRDRQAQSCAGGLIWFRAVSASRNGFLPPRLFGCQGNGQRLTIGHHPQQTNPPHARATAGVGRRRGSSITAIRITAAAAARMRNRVSKPQRS
jgi:hypothetical protein